MKSLFLPAPNSNPTPVNKAVEYPARIVGIRRLAHLLHRSSPQLSVLQARKQLPMQVGFLQTIFDLVFGFGAATLFFSPRRDLYT